MKKFNESGKVAQVDKKSNLKIVAMMSIKVEKIVKVSKESVTCMLVLLTSSLIRTSSDHA